MVFASVEWVYGFFCGLVVLVLVHSWVDGFFGFEAFLCDGCVARYGCDGCVIELIVFVLGVLVVVSENDSVDVAECLVGSVACEGCMFCGLVVHCDDFSGVCCDVGVDGF